MRIRILRISFHVLFWIRGLKKNGYKIYVVYLVSNNLYTAENTRQWTGRIVKFIQCNLIFPLDISIFFYNLLVFWIYNTCILYASDIIYNTLYTVTHEFDLYTFLFVYNLFFLFFFFCWAIKTPKYFTFFFNSKSYIITYL